MRASDRAVARLAHRGQGVDDLRLARRNQRGSMASGVHRATPPAARSAASAAVLALWHGRQRDCKLLTASVPPAQTGTLWSQSLATRSVLALMTVLAASAG